MVALVTGPVSLSIVAWLCSTGCDTDLNAIVASSRLFMIFARFGIEDYLSIY